ncbi:MAG: hypothetical protein GY707_16125, partial [Desulfobacteraceae bacterium]|nr:hypothetical protein [Desulfobacteraceae bacterium]
MTSTLNLKPFHLFEQKGCRCLINIEDMSAQSVDEKTFVLLEKLNAESGTALQSGTAEHLSRFGLIADG